ncbi:hypothetical protein OBBRIDRAFT_794479 [Obba rivulosa]|uniref:Uncharacterized protein n=1 Tax=Obba rivulosa TaxID=1052685 RepID=A0A8E2AW87_9APHY|nr:hypothetical protein OBBRIDRAFT_794479 [Obba rivulosa]
MLSVPECLGDSPHALLECVGDAELITVWAAFWVKVSEEQHRLRSDARGRGACVQLAMVIPCLQGALMEKLACQQCQTLDMSAQEPVLVLRSPA